MTPALAQGVLGADTIYDMRVLGVGAVVFASVSLIGPCLCWCAFSRILSDDPTPAVARTGGGGGGGRRPVVGAVPAGGVDGGGDATSAPAAGGAAAVAAAASDDAGTEGDHLKAE